MRAVDEPESWFACEGNAAHELSEWCRREKKPAEHWRGEKLIVGPYEFVVDQEMIDGVNDYVQYCEALPGLALYEERVFYDEWVPNGFGTLDDGRLTDGLCWITDLKYGKGVQVWAKQNSQLKLYALGLYHGFKHLYAFKKFILGIHQPRLEHIDTFEIELDELLEWAENVVRPIARRALEPGAEIKAGDHCTFCAVRKKCRTRAEYVSRTVLESDFENIEDAPLREIAFMTNDEVAAALPRAPNIKKWCNDLKSHAFSELAKGRPVGDWKIVEGRGSRALKPDAEAGLLLEVSDPSILYDRHGELKSPAQLEKVIGKKRIDDLIIKSAGKPTLVPGDDPREPMMVDAADEFENIEEE